MANELLVTLDGIRVDEAGEPVSPFWDGTEYQYEPFC